MASNTSYIKGVRTRYINILKKETKIAQDLLASSELFMDETEVIIKCNSCIERLQIYCDKVEIQTEKLADAIGDSDNDLTSQMVDENQSICDTALECVMKLKEFKDTVSMTKEKKAAAKEKYNFDQIVDLQKQMNSIVADQMKQQTEILEKQEVRERELTTTVKLPKLDMVTFTGDKLKWTEFWDSYECAIHTNKKLSDIEKFNYLKSKVTGEAKSAILGLALSKENYPIAVEILKDRFGNQQEVIDLHYSKMINLSQATNKTHSLRCMLDNIERHIRSLEVLKQNINQDIFVSMIRSKLPEDVLLQLEMLNGAKNKWTVETLRIKLHEYVTAREHAEKKDDQSDNASKRDNPSRLERTTNPGPNANSGFRTSHSRSGGKSMYGTNTASKQVVSDRSRPKLGSAEALVVNTKQTTSVTRFFDQCRYCDKRHWSDECPKYRTVHERKKQLKDSCYKCLKTGHMSRDCKKGKTCVHCGEMNAHHRSLCPKKFKNTISSAHLTEEVSAFSEDSVCAEENVLVSSAEIVLMQTARTEIKNCDNSRSEQVRILLDSGSQRTYITESLAEKLLLKKESEEEIKLVTFGSNKPKTVKTTQTKLKIKLNDGQFLDISANIVPIISGIVQRKALNLCSSKNMDHLIKSLDMADTIPSETESSTVELLVGNDYYLDLILSHKIEIQPGLYLLASKLGWILTGRTCEHEQNANETNMLILTYGTNITQTNVFKCIDEVAPRKPDLEDFWNIENIGIFDNPKTTNDEMVKTQFKETLTFEDGRYYVQWPWKEENPDLPINRELALGRLKSNVSRMKNKPEVMKQYDSIIQDQLEKGVIEKVNRTNEDGAKHYLPHHAVINPQKPTTKLRVVYDASAKTKKENKSLNECLYRGPVLLNDLCALLMRFRLNQIAIVADIEKAFLQIGLQPCQRDVTRFIWLKDCNKARVDNDNIQEYRFCRVPFGVISSPFLLGATIESHLESYESDIALKLKDDIYVDNLITGTNTAFEAVELYREAKSIFSEASMNLREWISNDNQVNQFFDNQDRTNCDSVKVLGHTWKIETDSLSLKKPHVSVESKNPTKRSILRDIASVFDPLGLLSPVLLNGKVLLQSLWKKHLEWDDVIECEHMSAWSKVSSDMAGLSDVFIKRCIGMNGDNCNIKYYLICFCDASLYAYAAVIYLLQINAENKSKADLIFSKTRLAPVKEMTIPRLELMAVVIGVRCLRFVKQHLKLPVEGTFVWTDSQCVLKWINTDKDLSVFVRNRVKEIVDGHENAFGYVSSRENPADLATRGSNVQKLVKSDLWWHGPQWLKQSQSEWPGFVYNEEERVNADFDSEIKQLKSVKETELLATIDEIHDSASYFSGESTPFGIKSEKYSSITKLLRVTAFALRFINKLKGSKYRGPLSNSEIDGAEKMWVLYIQRKNFKDVYEAITKGKSNNLKKQLGLYLDNDGLLRCKGRIDQADVSESARRPVLLPKSDPITDMLIYKVYKQSLYSGVSQCLSQLRYKYWITHGRATVRSVLRKCTVCRRHEGGPYKMPLMAPLPKTRVTEAVAFSRTGLDYLGPMFIKTSDGEKKVWVCLFTCLVTRAIHLELLQDMTAEEFLLGFRRFISQRGTPVEILSDNAKQFKTASKTLDLVWKHMIKCPEVQDHVSNSGVKWSFMIELAPWMGGFYERLVSLVKRALRKTLNRKLLSLVQLQTVLKEVEATVNARPLVYVGDDIDSTMTLTPRHFLTLNPTIGVPELEYDTIDRDYNPYESTTERLLQTWKKGQRLLNMFWKIWRDEYLLSLRERTQSKLKSGRVQSDIPPSVGDVVLIKENIPRGCWKFGKVVSLVQSRDGFCRSAKVSLASGRIIGRPLNLLFPVEASGEISDFPRNSEKQQLVSPNQSESNQRPTRSAAKHAKMKIKQLLSE